MHIFRPKLKMCVKFQKDRPKTARGVALTRKHKNVTYRQTDRLGGKTICLPTPSGWGERLNDPSLCNTPSHQAKYI